MWTFRRRQRERCAMLAPQPGAVMFLIMNASVAGKYAYCFLVVSLIYFSDKQNMHSRRMKQRGRKKQQHRMNHLTVYLIN